MKSKKLWIGLAVLAVIVVLLFVSMKNRGGHETAVNTAKVERADLISKVTANGKIEAQRKVDLSANVMGQIVNLAVREGDTVKKGDFLMQIDKAQLAASAAGAQASVEALFSDREASRATLAEAQRSFQRAQKNYNDKIIPLAELDKARAAHDSASANVNSIERRIEQARAGLAGARDTLSKTTMRAPMSGLVTRLPVEEGEVAVIGTMNNAGTVLMTISDMSIVEAVMQVDETDIPAVRVGQKANVTVDAYPNKTFAGVVTEVGSSPIATASGNDAINFEVKIQLTDPPAGIRPGFSASADIQTGFRPQAISIPIQALVVRDKETPGKGAKGTTATTSSAKAAKTQEEEGVYRVDGTDKSKTVKFVNVQTGLTGETSIEIVSGVKPGDEIVIGPFKALREIKDGEKIKVEKEETGDKKDAKKS
jgi:HlyD family secretion protein